ncbi:MAG: tyrosine-protein phosphatase [Oscillospiraceae bacterium]|nr:tyrosine-protein phosphatase [Oscillospiraceae bacterium]
MAIPREEFTADRTPDGYALTASRPGAFRVYWATSPDGFCDDNDLGAFEGAASVADPFPGRRVFFHILQDGRYSVTTPRSIPAGGMRNLRDVGGYTTADGAQFVRYGRVYRSDMLCLCGEEHLPSLEALGIRRIVDLRSSFDFHDPDTYDPPLRGAAHEFLPMYGEQQSFNFTLDEALRESRERLEECYGVVSESYVDCLFDSDALRRLFRRLADGETPLLFHCYAGKDRTGIAAALLLRLLGVPRETILYDYMLTRETRKAFSDGKIAEYGDLIRDEEMLRWVEFFTLVLPESIESTLDAVSQRYGDADDYYLKELKLTPEDLAHMRAMYLTRH